MVHTNINNVRPVPLHIHFRGKHTKYNNLTTKKLRGHCQAANELPYAF